MHPDFEAIIESTIALRDALAPNAKISVLSNATQLHREDVVRALRRVDNNILKLDSAFDATAAILNKPCCKYSVATIIEQLSQFNGQFILQTMFLSGVYNNKPFDNTTEEEVVAWLKVVEMLRPQSVMVYSIARDTPCKTLKRVEREQLEAIAKRVEALGVTCTVA